MVGMSVVGPDFEKLKRFNLAELRDASRDKETDSTKEADKPKGKSAEESESAPKTAAVEKPSEA